MREHDRLFIGGDWVPPAGGGTIEVVSPHSERVIGRVPDGTPADVDRAVAAAREAFDRGPWPRTDPAERAAAVTRLGDAFARRKGEVGALLTAEMGAPISQPLQAEAVPVIWHYFAELGRTFAWEEERPAALGPFVVRREPVGVVAAIVPWNIPQSLTALKLAPALVAGCTVVLKPAPETPLDPYLLAEMVVEAGIPPGVVNIVAAGRETGEHLVRHPGVDKVAFTGSTAAGRRIGAICGEQLKRCSLELGGKSAAIVCDDADLGATVEWLKFASLAVNGQACAAQTRILAPRSRYDEVVEALAGMVAGLRIANDSDYGLAGSVWTSDPDHGRRIARQVRAGIYGVNTFMLDPCALRRVRRRGHRPRGRPRARRVTPPPSTAPAVPDASRTSGTAGHPLRPALDGGQVGAPSAAGGSAGRGGGGRVPVDRAADAHRRWRRRRERRQRRRQRGKADTANLHSDRLDRAAGVQREGVRKHALAVVGPHGGGVQDAGAGVGGEVRRRGAPVLGAGGVGVPRQGLVAHDAVEVDGQRARVPAELALGEAPRAPVAGVGGERLDDDHVVDGRVRRWLG